MKTVIRLEESDDISKIKPGECYVGELLPPDKVKLCTLVTATLDKPTILCKSKEIAVRIKRIRLPGTIESELVTEEFCVVDSWDFLIKSTILDKLLPSMRSAARLILSAIESSEPILLKHHADCDGYIGAIALERAILSLIKKTHRNHWYYFKRMPCKSPVYEYADAVKDLSSKYDDIGEGKTPLIIVLDNGSSSQDLLGLKKLQLFNTKLVIVDHHKPKITNGKAAVGLIAEVFINPYNVGGDSNLTAGMLGVELSRLVAKVDKLEHLPAISGIADKSQGSEIESYLQLAEKSGYGKDLLTLIAHCIDFEAYYIGFQTSSLIDDLLFNKQNRDQKIELVKNEMEKRFGHIAETVKQSDIRELDDKVIVSFNSSILKRGEYPTQGKATGFVFSKYKEKYDKPVVLLGIGEDSVTFRTKLKGFDVNKLVEEMEQKMPKAMVEGGGHEVAGTIHFAKDSKKEVLEFIFDYLK